MNRFKSLFLIYLVEYPLFQVEVGGFTSYEYELGSFPVKVPFAAFSSNEWSISQATYLILYMEISTGLSSNGAAGCLLTARIVGCR